MKTKLVKISKETYNRLDTELASNFKPMRIYEEEQIKNDNKREILLIDSTYVDKIANDFKALIKE